MRNVFAKEPKQSLCFFQVFARRILNANKPLFIRHLQNIYQHLNLYFHFFSQSLFECLEVQGLSCYHKALKHIFTWIFFSNIFTPTSFLSNHSYHKLQLNLKNSLLTIHLYKTKFYDKLILMINKVVLKL